MEGITNIVDEILLVIKNSIERYGWYAVAMLLFFYFAEPYYQQWIRKRSLRIANDPARVAILNEQKNRVRVNQQANFKGKSGI
jgi:hypothetical protein